MQLTKINLNQITLYQNDLKSRRESSNKDTATQNQSLTIPKYIELGTLTHFSGISFKGDGPHSTKSFAVRNLENLPCPSCGGVMLTRRQFNKFKTQLDEIPENQYIKLLGKYQQYMRPVELKVYIQAKALAEEKPHASLRSLLVQLRDQQIDALEAVQFSIIKKIENIASELPENECKLVCQEVNDAVSKIKLRDDEASTKRFKRMTFIERLKDIEISDPQAKKTMLKWAYKLPTSSELECAWIVKNSGKDADGNVRTSKEIAEKLLINSVVNTDHVLARNLGGSDNVKNYIAMHSGCNSEKSNKTIDKWLHEDPNRQFYLMIYLSKVQKAINKGVIDKPHYKNYAQDITKLIENLYGILFVNGNGQ